MSTKLQHLFLHERPREKLAASGPSVLSDIELLALLLGSGTKRQPVLRLAERVLEVVDTKGPVLSTTDLSILDGIGVAKATLLVAALEFARRRVGLSGTRIRSASDVYPLLRQYCDKRQEYFISVSLNGAHELIATRVVSKGLLNRALVHPREVFADPLCDRAAAVIIAHNHPSGELTPSNEDAAVTEQLVAAGKLLGIPVLDHLVLGRTGYYSFADAGRM